MTTATLPSLPSAPAEAPDVRGSELRTIDWFGYFAAHAPEIPVWFKRKEWREKVVEPMPKSPDGRTGWVHEVMKDRVEDPLEYLVRWRMAYAAAMVAALPNKLLSEPTKNAKQSAGSSVNCD